MLQEGCMPWENCPIPRANFDDFIVGFVSVFQMLTGEDWNMVMCELPHPPLPGGCLLNARTKKATLGQLRPEWGCSNPSMKLPCIFFIIIKLMP